MEHKWVSEIAENCPGVELVLVALKCDLRPSSSDEDDAQEPKHPTLTYKQGLEVAKRIQALRYLGRRVSDRPYVDANKIDRMLGYEESWSQRSLY